MFYWELLLAGLVGLMAGSFVSAVTYRLPKGLGFIKGRSFCDSCKKPLKWFYNLPVISFLALGGKSGCCGKKISLRYPLIEIFSCLGSLAVFYFTSSPWFVVFFLIVVSILVTDIEHMLIFDGQVNILTGFGIAYLLINSPQDVLGSIFAGFLSSSFFLLINLVTKGRGMGLGDVKLAFPLALILGTEKIFEWITLSFLTGGVVASILLVLGTAKLKSKIAFGPFLVLSFIVNLILDVKFF